MIPGLCIWPSVVGAQQGSSKTFQTRETAFSNGNIQLKATLFLPQRATNVPGLVVIHGSGDSDRSNPWTAAYAEALASRGIAVMHPDKRGCGQSSGDWRSSGFDDFANDARAALEALRKEPHLDPARLGLIGFSQGGDVLPLAASRDTNVSVTIDISGSVAPIAEQMADEVELSARRAGCSQRQIDALLQLNEKGLQLVRSGLESDWASYQNSLVLARNGDLNGSAVLNRFPDRPDHPGLRQMRKIIGYDPLNFWKEVKAPKLFIFGGQDTQVVVKKSLHRLENELKKNENYTVLLLNPNGHALFRDDVCDFIARWVKEAGKP